MYKKKILFIGGFPKPYNGQTIYNKIIFEKIKSNKIYIKKINTNIQKKNNDIGKFSIKKILLIFKIYKQFLNLYKNFNIFYIVPGHTFFGFLRSLFFLFFLKKQKKIILHHHGYGILKLIEKYNFLGSFISKPSVLNIVLTDDCKRKLKSLCNNINIVILKNFSKFKLIKYKRINKRLKILYLSSFLQEKGYYNFLKSSEKNLNCDFFLAGSGDAKTESLAKKFDKNSNFNFLGFVKEKRQFQLFYKSDIFVLQSYYKTEGVPLSLLDAMKNNCVIITTRHNGIPENVGNAGVYVKKNDFKDLSAKISFLNINRNELSSKKIKTTHMAKKIPNLNKHIKDLKNILLK